jgi:hypothetical protein
MDLKLYPPLPRRKDFRVGILGSGFIVNECHLPAYRKAGFNAAAIASRTSENARRAAERHGIAKVYDSYRQLLDDKSIEVLDIAVPPNVSLPLIHEACARRSVKGVLVQKPLGMDYPSAAEAVRACQTAGITLAVNQNMRYDHSVRAAKTLLENGTIGEPVLATIDMRGIPHWQPWSQSPGFGTLRLMSVHHLDTFRYWFGEPHRIYSSTRPDPRAKFSHADGICIYILEYRSGLRCVAIDDTWTGPAREGCPSDISITWRIEGLNGLAIGDIGWCRDPYTTPSRIKYAAKGFAGFETPTWPESWFPDAFSGTMGELLMSLEEGREPSISGRDNLNTMTLVDVARTSANMHEVVNLVLKPLGRPDSSEQTAETHETAGLETTFSTILKDKLEGRVEVRLVGHSTHSQILPEPGPPPTFTPRAQQALALARKEADRLHHNFVGTEHLLLGLAALGQGVAVTVLQKLSLDLDELRKEVERTVGKGPEQKVIGNIPYTPRVKKVLALAAKEAKRLNHTYVGTEHLLLGILQESTGPAAQVLTAKGINIEATRKAILKELDPNYGGD